MIQLPQLVSDKRFITAKRLVHRIPFVV